MYSETNWAWGNQWASAAAWSPGGSREREITFFLPSLYALLSFSIKAILNKIAGNFLAEWMGGPLTDNKNNGYN